ncbi:aminoglycoside phosphotransferase family protein [Phaeacidiphilus oryzae]|uniref:aminoglycoside phosphotransferase family protein n=1 Tax=Phaeacidiphilus oryzae TaxID=348818 RepID=UPI000566938A|nr:aminoglycoside phosphotransferase family protein [Phaeacidiphilus oryzae]
MTGVPVPERLRRTIDAWEGPAGQDWLARLPAAVEEFAERWGLTVERVPEPGGQISLVVLVRTGDGAPAVLKLGLVGPETAQEPAALACWDGAGAVRLLEADPERGAMLLERLSGEVSLRSLAASRAMLEAAETIRRLWIPAPDGHPFTTVEQRVRELLPTLLVRRDAAGNEELRPLADEAAAAAEALLAEPPAEEGPVLLHGDFHQGNVLAGERMKWLAIDPKPLVGERAYDLAWLVRDRLDTLAGSPGPASATRRRLGRLADALEVDQDRLRGWSLFRAVEAGLWCLAVGDRQGGELLLEFASWVSA